MKSEEIKKLFIKVLIGSLLGAAGIAVVAVLAGEFNEILGKALFTLGLVAFHALAALGVIENNQKNNGDNGLVFFINVIFAIIVLSFFTSVFGVWEVFTGELVGKLYATYFISLFASLHGELLAKTASKDATIDKVVNANYVFMGIVILLLLPIVWVPDTNLGDFYYRLLAANGIIDATLTILATILYKLYLQKHPEVKSTLFTVQSTKLDENGNPVQVQVSGQRRRVHPLLWLLGIYLFAQIFLSLIFAVFGSRF